MDEKKSEMPQYIEVGGAELTPEAINYILNLQYISTDLEKKESTFANNYIDSKIENVDNDMNFLIQDILRDENYEIREKLIPVLETLSDYRELLQVLKTPKTDTNGNNN